MVETLCYRVKIEGVDQSGLTPCSWEHALGKFRLADSKLVVELAQHFGDPNEAARAVQQQVLDTFSVESRLRYDQRITFDLQSSTGYRQEDGETKRVVSGHITIGISDSVSLIRVPQGIPYEQPSGNFAVDEDVRVAYRRWDAYLTGREPLPQAAYFILTLLGKIAGGRVAAVARFGICRSVLDQIGSLSSRAGTERTARKADYRKMTPDEQHWLREATRMLVLRLGEQGSSHSQITMADLPKLPANTEVQSS